ncbi:MAG: DUF485 domain-containing protein [Pseudomonadota bacterium]
MAALHLHGHVPREEEREEVVKFNTRLGVVLFFVYVLFYAGFVFLSAFAPETMGTPFLGGVNLSVIYGFALIIAALALALLYAKLCHKPGKAG